MTMKERILTGIRSNDMPHLGNYLGAMLPMVELQKKHAGSYDVHMFVPDLHSFTTPIDHDDLYQNTIRNLKFFVAAGLDIDNAHTYIYRQSYVPAHSELAWILDCFAYFGEMSRMTQFKEKSEKQDNVSVGLFNYPVLMAADILLYNAKYVPVGDDQKQHLEIARDIAMRVNNKFEHVYPEGVFQVIPDDWKSQMAFAERDNGLRIRSLRTPEKKMSKSVSDPAGTILLSDDPSDAAKKVMSATTDSIGTINFDWENQPGVTNLLQMLALFSERPLDEVIAEWTGRDRYGDLKKAVAEATEKFLTDFQARYDAVDEAKLVAKLEASEAAVTPIAEETLLRAQKAVGLRPR
jgi:tryptophanyl-tRNA synthetase